MRELAEALIDPEILTGDQSAFEGYTSIEFHGNHPDDFVAIAIPDTAAILKDDHALRLFFTRYVHARRRQVALRPDTPESFFENERFG